MGTKYVSVGLLVIIYFLALSAVLLILDAKIKHDNESLTKRSEGKVSSVATAEEINLKLNDLADSVTAYVSGMIDQSFWDNTLGISKDIEIRVVQQLLDGHNSTWDNVKRLEDLTMALSGQMKWIFVPPVRVTNGKGIADYYNREVEMGRLSERYKVVPGVTLPEDVLIDLRNVLNKMKLKNITNAVMSRRDDPLLIHEAKYDKDLPNWKRFHNAITKYELYPENGLVDQLVGDLQKQKITGAYNTEDGTEIKLILTLEDGNKALFKPMRFPRDIEAWPDQYYYFDLERHTGEIAAFHLDRLFGFRRVPPVAGRFINVTSEILQVLNDSDIKKTFFTTMEGNRCFYSKCAFFCDPRHAVCGHPHILEGSLMTWLPPSERVPLTEWINPWRRSYSKSNKAEWEHDAKYCDKVKTWEHFKRGRRLLDLMDLVVFDFINGNLDRHDYYTYEDRYGSEAHIINYDNGRGYGRSKYDDMSILTALTQCCLIRLSTLGKLYEFATGSKPISERLEESLSRDALYPVLTKDQLQAVDRRVRIVLREIHRCLRKRASNYTQVVLDDGI